RRDLRRATHLVVRRRERRRENEREDRENQQRKLALQRQRGAIRRDGGAAAKRSFVRGHFAPSWPSPFSSDRHRYQQATELCGLQRAPIFFTCLGVGRLRKRYARRIAFWMPRSSSGSTSGRPRRNIRNICAVQRPMPFTWT